jgi:hypothetical protein
MPAYAMGLAVGAPLHKSWTLSGSDGSQRARLSSRGRAYQPPEARQAALCVNRSGLFRLGEDFFSYRCSDFLTPRTPSRSWNRYGRTTGNTILAASRHAAYCWRSMNTPLKSVGLGAMP